MRLTSGERPIFDAAIAACQPTRPHIGLWAHGSHAGPLYTKNSARNHSPTWNQHGRARTGANQRRAGGAETRR
jgi:hypothetical protein